MPRSRWDELPPPVRTEILVLSFVPPLSSVVLGGPILLLFLQERSVGLAMAFYVWLAATFIVTLYLMLRLLDDLESLPETRTPEELRLERRQSPSPAEGKPR